MQWRIQEFGKGASISFPSPSFPPTLSVPSSSPPSLSIPSHSLKVRPFKSSLGVWGNSVNSLTGSQLKSNVMHFCLKIGHLVATILSTFHWGNFSKVHFWPYSRLFTVQGGGHGPSGLMVNSPLRTRRAKRRHQSPRVDYSQLVNCFIQNEVIGFQVLLDSLHPRSMRTSWWSPPVLQGGKLLRSSWHQFHLAHTNNVQSTNNTFELTLMQSERMHRRKHEWL